MTNAAKVALASVLIDESRKEITIPVKQRSYERKRSIFFGERYKLLSIELIDSKLIINNVVSHKIHNNLNLPEIHFLFGVIIKNKEIRFYSTEEQSGVTAYEMYIKVQSYDIELRDEKQPT